MQRLGAKGVVLAFGIPEPDNEQEGLREELQSTSEAGHPANSTAQPSCPVITTEDTDFPGTPIPAVPARFSDKWTRITSLVG